MTESVSSCGSCTLEDQCNEMCPEEKEKNKPLSFSTRKEIKSVIAIMSGKGGVGKSTVTALLASAMARKGFRIGVLDGDITGPSIPRLFGLKGGHISTSSHGILPCVTNLGIKVMSLNLFFSREDEAVIWRGPLLA